MGWFALIGIKELASKIDMNGVILIILGGVLFSIGILFYISEKIKYGHAIWHLFYISGCICHYFAIIIYSIPYQI